MSDLFSPPQPLLILLSGADEYVPASVNVPQLLGKWLQARAGKVTFGVVVNGADHAVSGVEEQEVVVGWVVECLESLG